MRRLFFIALVLGAGFWGVTRLQARPAAPSVTSKPQWSIAKPGVEWRRLQWPDGNGGLARVTLVRAPANRIHIATGGTFDAEQWRKKTGAVAAVNGGYFDNEGHSLGLRVSGGVKQTRMHGDRWGVFFVSANGRGGRGARARIVDAADYKAVTRGLTVTEAVQCGPQLVIAGRQAKLKPQSARRTGIGVDRQGRVILAVADGWVKFDSWAKLWGSNLNCRDALNLDGGPSTQLSLETQVSDLEVDGGWGTPDAVIVR